MIADLKADSERWEAERRQRGQPSNGISSRDSNGQVRSSNTPIVEYRSSDTHYMRQHHGPSSEAVPATTQGYSASGTYAGAGPSVQQGPYEPTYQQYAQQPAVYADPGYNAPNEYYVSGANLSVDRSGQPVVPQTGQVPRTGQVQYQNYPPADTRGYAYQGQTAPSPVYAQGSAQQPDPFYGRGAYNQTLLS
jgi:hypothetical protein